MSKEEKPAQQFATHCWLQRASEMEAFSSLLTGASVISSSLQSLSEPSTRSLGLLSSGNQMKSRPPGRCSDRQPQAVGTNLEVIAVSWSPENRSLNRKCGKPVELFIQQKQTRLQIQISPLLTSDPLQSWVIMTPLGHGLYAF